MDQFINMAAGKEVATVSGGMASCTSTIEHFVVLHKEDPTRHLVFVDAPGFNEAWQDEDRKLRQIVDWLAHS
jgi:GTPase Era involved in 16S rRNA processing